MRREHEGSAVGAAGDIGGCHVWLYLSDLWCTSGCTEQKLKDQRESERIKSMLSVGKDAQYELVLS